ncbi:MAG: two-component regulator propeller domain-containing protein [Bacteroidota bacterium]|nr:two-component regulator propeller domain-containing protein [Bacteroidota bacterium]
MKFRIILILFAITGCLSVNAISYKINYLTADNGLAQNMVDHIFRDSRGFMWISTWNGLDRYDGYEFVHFNSRNSANSLRSDNVHCVEEDSQGNLLIATETGIDFLDYRTGKIIHSEQKFGKKMPFDNRSIAFIQKDDNGDFWIGYDTGISIIHISADGNATAEEICKSRSAITSILIQSSSIYVGHSEGVFRLIKGTNGKYNRINAGEAFRNFNRIVNTFFYDNGVIWIGTTLGLYKFDPGTEKLIPYVANPGNPNALTSSFVTDIKKNKDGQLLIGTLIGLNVYDYRTDQFTHFTSESIQDGVSLNNNFVNCLYIDNQTVWIGTEKGGVNLLIPDQKVFTNYVHLPTFTGSLSRNPVNAIYEDEAGGLWVGTVEGGLNLRKKGASEFTHFTTQNGLSHNSISYICRDVNNDYWFATWGMGINRMKLADKSNPKFKQFVYNPADKNGIQNNFVAAMISDSKNKGLWIGTREGLDFFDLQSNRFIHVLNYLPVNKRIMYSTGMYIDTKNRLWIGTGNGLFCIYLNKTDLKRNKITYRHFLYQLSNPLSHRVEKINCIHQCKNGELWFGSNGNGLYRMDENDGRMIFHNVNENMGLSDNVIYGMLEDETGTFWLSTDKGLCAYNPEKNSFRSFNTSDGLRSNQFYWNAYCKGHDGKMYFGHVAGLTEFDPLKTTPVAAQNRVSLTRIKVLNDDIYPANLKQNGQHLFFKGGFLSNIELKEADKAFSFEFSALSYTLPEKIKYAYRLRGFDNEWTEVLSDRRFASYTNLKSGKYTFEVKCTNPDGTWSNEITGISIVVIPPFYKTWWFLILVIGILVYSAYKYYVYRIQLLKKQKLHLKQMVDERTREIEYQKEVLENQAKELQFTLKELIDHQDEISRQNEVLTQQNEKITRQKAQLVEMAKKVQEATLDKIAFFTNITHEFRTPITLIMGPVERALKLSQNPAVQEQLQIVQRNSKLLLSLINQLMDFRKVDSGKMEIVKTQNNFLDFLDNLILPFEELVKDRSIVIRKQYRIEQPEFPFDPNNMQKVIGNLLSNAIKFTPDKGIITVIASTYLDKLDKKERLYVAIKDNGKGISEEDIEKVFDRFYQSKQSEAYAGYGQSGTGIGLYLSKRLVQLHNGKIEARNNRNGGACFRFFIPIERGLTTVVSVDGKPMQMLVANPGLEKDQPQFEITKGKPVLLIVEDNADMRQYVKSILKEDYNILEAANGAIGLELTNRYQPDLIISDIMMPVMDGLEFCKKVKSNFVTSHIPVILLTAKSATDTQIESFNQGADAFLVKPFNEDLLKAMIQNLNERRQRVQMRFADSMDTGALNIAEESQDKKFMDKALKVIKENYTDSNFDVSEFIDTMGISRSLLHKKLQNLAGQSASRFIRTYRLNVARELIVKNRINHTLNISEIAYEVGFNDPKYFTRCFTKHFGVTPSSFLDEGAEA